EPEKVSDPVPRRVRKSHRFSLGGATLPDVPLAVVGGGRESCPAGHTTRRGGSPHYSLEFVSRGRGWLTSDGKRHRLDAGTVFSHGPGFAHSITADPRNVLEKYFVDLTGPRAPRILAECGLPPGTVARVSSVNEVEDI